MFSILFILFHNILRGALVSNFILDEKIHEIIIYKIKRDVRNVDSLFVLIAKSFNEYYRNNEITLNTATKNQCHFIDFSMVDADFSAYLMNIA